MVCWVAIYTTQANIDAASTAEIGPVTEVGTRVAKTYRLTKAEFETLDKQWKDTSYIGTSLFCNDPANPAACKKDGTVYFAYMHSLAATAY